MKTSEIADYIAQRNVRMFIGGEVPFLPLAPVIGARTGPQVGWVAYQLARFADPGVCGTGVLMFHFSERLGAFALMSPSYAARSEGGWEQVQWDGYGELASWREVQ